jgi:magnesium chelatase subunit I
VSVRLSIANYETLVANATRRAVRHGESEVVPRVSDLDALVASTSGKVEFEMLDEGREEQVLDRLVASAVLTTFRARTRPEKLGELVTAFEGGLVVHTGDDIASAEYAGVVGGVPVLRELLADLDVGETPAGVASAIELVLEGLHLSKRLNKDAVDGRATYRARG